MWTGSMEVVSQWDKSRNQYQDPNLRKGNKVETYERTLFYTNRKAHAYEYQANAVYTFPVFFPNFQNKGDWTWLMLD